MMFISKLLVVLCVLGIVKANFDYNLRVIDSIYDELLCLSRGGKCTIATDCKPGALTEQKGLCPSQRSKGVECCYGISQKETRCRKRGGECMPSCSERLVDKLATDCLKGTRCCTLVI